MAYYPKTVCVTSYNSGGLGLDRQNFIKTLNIFSDIFWIQEHFLLDAGGKKHSNTYKLKTLFGDTHDMLIKPAFKESNAVTKGRGMGGLVIMWKRGFTKYILQVKSDSFRIQAVKFNFPEADLLLFNLYFMVDPQNNAFNDNELLSLLAEIEQIIARSECRNVLLAGDINCDFSRNTPMVNIIRDFVNTTGLNIFWSMPDNSETHRITNIPFTYVNTVNNVTHSSVIDHFLGNDRLFNAVVEADVIVSADNHSNHLPIYCKLNIELINLNVEPEIKRPKPSWDKANLDQRQDYDETLNNLLLEINPPELCVECYTLNCDVHTEDVEQYAANICEAVNTAAIQCLPVVGSTLNKHGNGIPGWSEYVKPYQEESLFWHGVWMAAGCPDQGELYNVNRTAKMQYKYAVRRLKRANYNMQKDKFMQSLLNGGVNIFNEIKKFRGNSKTVSSSIDGVVGAQNISEHFAAIYQDLYSKHLLGEEFKNVNEQINNRIIPELESDLDKVNNSTVRAALRKLKPGKSDAFFQFNSDCFINAPDSLINHVTQLFKWFLRTGKIPHFLLICSLVPIVKDNLSDICNSDNYRAIAIGSLLLKWFDWLILILDEDKLSSDELQFGFQPDCSTTMCSWAVSSVIDYYNQAGRPVYACAMDLSKAFDLVSWDKLFPDLLERNISVLSLRCLIHIYKNQTCNVKWTDSLSHCFQVTNGVRQGAVSSPILFCIYINDLIKQLRLSTIGCQIQGIYLGIWVYADDIILLSPSRNGLQEMINICEKFALNRKLKFSTNVDINKSKTKCVIFNKSNIDSNNVCPIILNGVPLPYVNEFKHLGNLFQSDNSMTRDCNLKRAKFISIIHSLNQEFHFSEPTMVVKLYNIYASSLYGSNLWDLFCVNTVKLYTSWNTAIRILFGLPRQTHRYFIEQISEQIHLKTMLCSRFVSFCESMCKSRKLSIRLLFDLCKNDQRTKLCKNLSNIANETYVDKLSLNKSLVKSNMIYANPAENAWRIPLLKDLLLIRSNPNVLEGFNYDEIDVIIDDICKN